MKEHIIGGDTSIYLLVAGMTAAGIPFPAPAHDFRGGVWRYTWKTAPPEGSVSLNGMEHILQPPGNAEMVFRRRLLGIGT